MPTPSPIVHVDGAFPQNGHVCTAGETVTITLAENTGVDTWTVSAFSCDDRHVLTDVTIAETGPFEREITVPNDSGSTFLFKSVVNGGVSGIGAAARSNPAYTATFGLFVEPSSGLKYRAPNQTSESSQTHGYTVDDNALIDEILVALDAVEAITDATAESIENTLVLRDEQAGAKFSILHAQQVLVESGTSAPLILGCESGQRIDLYEGATKVLELDDQSGVSVLSGRGTTATRLESNAGQLRLQCPSASNISLMEGASTTIATFADETNVSTLTLPGTGGAAITASAGNLTLSSASAGTISLKEGSTSIFNVLDSSGIATFEGQGSSGARFSTASSNMFLTSGSGFAIFLQSGAVQMMQVAASGASIFADMKGTTSNVIRVDAIGTPPLILRGASGGYVGIEEGTTEVARFSDESNVSTISLRGSSGGTLSTNASNLSLASASGSHVAILESTTEIARFSDESNVSTISLRGSSGGNVVTNTGVLNLSSASGSHVAIRESTTDVARFYDESNTATIELRGSAGEVTHASSNLKLSANSAGALLILEAGAENDTNSPIAGIVKRFAGTTGGRTVTDNWHRLQTTTAASQGLWLSSEINDGECVMIEARIIGNGGAQGAGYFIRGTFRAAGGVVTQIGVTEKSSVEDDSAWDVSFSVSDAQVQINAQGNTGDNVAWECWPSTYLCGAYV